jgi:hypothetical protein
MNCQPDNHSLYLPNYATKIQLPSPTSYWVKDGEDWNRPPPIIYTSNIMESTFVGVKPNIQADDYAFLTIISTALDHICTFETLTKSTHTDLYPLFISKMSNSLDLLDEMWNEQHANKETNGALPTPLVQCTRALLDSAFYHLHGSPQLTGMTRLLKSPELAGQPDEVERIRHISQRGNIEKALFRAAATLRIDCRLGLRYMQKVAPHRFAPLSATSVAEGGMFQDVLTFLLVVCFSHSSILLHLASSTVLFVNVVCQVFSCTGISISNPRTPLSAKWTVFWRK